MDDKNKTKVIVCLSILLLLCVGYIFYTSQYQHTDTELTKTIEDLRRDNQSAREQIMADRELQGQYRELQSTATKLIGEREAIIAERDNLKRERDQALERVGELIRVSDEIGDAMGSVLEESYAIIEQGREDIRQVGNTD